MDDRLRVDIPPRYVMSHPGQLSLLPSVERKMSTSQRARRCAVIYQYRYWVTLKSVLIIIIVIIIIIIL